MANHVNTNVEFHRISTEGKTRFEEIVSRVRKPDGTQTYEWFSDIWVDGKDGSPTYDETMKYVWTNEHVGPKWCYFDEIGDEYFQLTSAWSYPEAGLTWLVEQIAEVDPSVIMTATFEDEGANFYGSSVFDKDGLYESTVIDHDEMIDDMHSSIPELLALYDEDAEDEEVDEATEEGDQSDEYNDMKNELMWEHIANDQSETISNIVDSITEE
jgi:hypothetical protein